MDKIKFGRVYRMKVINWKIVQKKKVPMLKELRCVAYRKKRRKWKERNQKEKSMLGGIKGQGVDISQ